MAKALRKVLPLRMYKLVANGAIIAPGYYKSVIKDLEHYHTVSLDDSVEKQMMLMRKYAHIIDKGLHRKDVTPGHSKNVYTDLKYLLNSLSDTHAINDPSYQWAQNRISAYESLQSSPEDFVPMEGEIAKISIDYDSLSEFLMSRRTNRIFSKKLVSQESWEKITRMAHWAPSSCNKQPVKVFSTLDPATASKCMTCCAGATGFGKFIPGFAAIAVQSQGYVWPMEYGLPYVDGSLAAQNMILAANSLGITGCFLTWAQKNEASENELRRILNIPTEYIIIINLVFGYAETTFSTPTRKLQ